VLALVAQSRRGVGAAVPCLVRSTFSDTHPKANMLASFLLSASAAILAPARAPAAAKYRARPVRAAAPASPAVVWYTGAADLRIDDHPGLRLASEAGAPIVCAFVLDESAHLACAPATSVLSLHSAVSSLQAQLTERYNAKLCFRVGGAHSLLPSLCADIGASVCYAPPEDPCATMRRMQIATTAALAAGGVEVRRWGQPLRPSAPWEEAEQVGTNSGSSGGGGDGSSGSAPGGRIASLPRRHDVYTMAASRHAVAPPQDAPAAINMFSLPSGISTVWAGGIPSAAEWLRLAAEASPAALLRARLDNPTTQPHAQAAVTLSGEAEARRALNLYCASGQTAFAKRYLNSAAAAPSSPTSLSPSSPTTSSASPTHLADTGGGGTEGALARSLYAAAAEWIEGNAGLASRGALREVACIGFRSVLALGSLSPRRVIATAAAAAGGGGLGSGGRRGGDLSSPFATPPWGLTDARALMDVVEWHEWHRLLANRDVAAADAEARVRGSGAAAGAGGIAAGGMAGAGAEGAGAAGAGVSAGSLKGIGAGAAAKGAAAAGGGVAMAAAVLDCMVEGGTEEECVLREAGLAGTTPADAADEVAYWRWNGHLIRYRVWHGREGKGSAARVGGPFMGNDGWGKGPPPLVSVHGFAASSAQWGRLVRAMRRATAGDASRGMDAFADASPDTSLDASGDASLDASPAMYALDMLGFGHSESPPLSYTQHLWEALVVDFCLEVAGAAGGKREVAGAAGGGKHGDMQPARTGAGAGSVGQGRQVGAHPAEGGGAWGPPRGVVLVGNSIGGGISAGAAANLGSLARGLVLCNTAGELTDPRKDTKGGRAAGVDGARDLLTPAELGAGVAKAGAGEPLSSNSDGGGGTIPNPIPAQLGAEVAKAGAANAEGKTPYSGDGGGGAQLAAAGAGAGELLAPTADGAQLSVTSAGRLSSSRAATLSRPSVGALTLAGALPPYQPLPFASASILELFGSAVITLLRPRIPSLLTSYYPTAPLNADAAQVGV
jgi:pimeloyl-ACP methyl ester carboxylesterase